MAIDKFQTLFDRAPFCVHEIAADGQLLSMNPAGLALVGASDQAAIRGRNFLTYVCPRDRSRVRCLMEEALTGVPRVFELNAANPGLPQHFVSCFIPCLDATGKVERLLGISHDISRVEREGSELRTLARTHAVISRCNRSLARSVDESALVRGFCADLVEVGGYGFAWIGYCRGAPPARVRMAASAGAADDALRAAVVAAANAVDGACRAAAPRCCPRTLPDLTADPRLAPWRARGRHSGYRSMVTLPLRTDRDCIGLIGILATKHDAFGDAERALLTELAEDLAFGIAAARARAVQVRQQYQLREEAEADARKRIAAALHDEVGQSLQAVNLGLKRARASVHGGESLPDGLLDALIEELGAALHRVREIGQELRPLVLERLPFVDAVRTQCSDFATRAGIDIQCRADRLDPEPDTRVKYQCFLGFREALCNAVRHAGASRIRVSVRAWPPGNLTMTVIDNGAGFDAKADDGQPPGLGLCTLRERTELLGGQVSIRSRAGQGTRVRISVPIAWGIAP